METFQLTELQNTLGARVENPAKDRIKRFQILRWNHGKEALFRRFHFCDQPIKQGVSPGGRMESAPPPINGGLDARG